MKVKDLLPMEIDIDCYDDVCEELGIAFCGPLKLTEEGQQKFAEVLEYDIQMIAGAPGGFPCVIVKADDKKDGLWMHRLAKAKEFFESAAGYCAYEDYNRWFKEDTE